MNISFKNYNFFVMYICINVTNMIYDKPLCYISFKIMIRAPRYVQYLKYYRTVKNKSSLYLGRRVLYIILL